VKRLFLHADVFKGVMSRAANGLWKGRWICYNKEQALCYSCLPSEVWVGGWISGLAAKRKPFHPTDEGGAKNLTPRPSRIDWISTETRSRDPIVRPLPKLLRRCDLFGAGSLGSTKSLWRSHQTTASSSNKILAGRTCKSCTSHEINVPSLLSIFPSSALSVQFHCSIRHSLNNETTTVATHEDLITLSTSLFRPAGDSYRLPFPNQLSVASATPSVSTLPGPLSFWINTQIIVAVLTTP